MLPSIIDRVVPLCSMIQHRYCKPNPCAGVEAKADFVLDGDKYFLRVDRENDLVITSAMKIEHLAESIGLDREVHAPGPRNAQWWRRSGMGTTVWPGSIRAARTQCHRGLCLQLLDALDARRQRAGSTSARAWRDP